MLSRTTGHFLDVVYCNEYSGSPCTVTQSLPPGYDIMNFVQACTPFVELVAKMSLSLQTLTAVKDVMLYTYTVSKVKVCVFADCSLPFFVYSVVLAL